ncbi:hypothetical protein EUX98_g2278 [Antrodiella citrinella]|uniref:RGS domain-containing protein n=1 Tax=Antrodiella citrinella TaxID=2447956 RepID=A0A4S4N7P3_9APHY|nr:hypothetical protein EUX98_g2278 [Antrodiella citrinella]
MPWFEPSPLTTITLDQVISGHTCEPITLADFEAYLEYQEHTVENLQFVVWYQSYRTRFLEITKQPKCVATAFTFCTPDAARMEERVRQSERMFDAWTGAGQDGEAPPPVTPISPISPHSDVNSTSPLTTFPTTVAGREQQATVSFRLMNREVDYLNNLPLKNEYSAVVKTFIQSGSPKELSLSDEMREMVLRDATWNTHPDVFLPVYEQIYDTLSTQSLPTFLKLSATNVNFPKAFYWYAFGALYVVFSLVVFFPFVFLGPPEVHKRAWRAISIPFSSLGVMQVYSGWKGLCTEVWSRGRAQLRPWDLQFMEDQDQAREVPSGPVDEEKGLKPQHEQVGTGSSSTLSVLEKAKNGETSTNTRTASGTSTTASPSSPSSAPSAPSPNNHKNEFPFESPKQVVDITAKPTMFGPERPLLDPRIRKVHALIVRDMLLVGVVWTAVWVAVDLKNPLTSIRTAMTSKRPSRQTTHTDSQNSEPAPPPSPQHNPKHLQPQLPGDPHLLHPNGQPLIRIQHVARLYKLAATPAPARVQSGARGPGRIMPPRRRANGGSNATANGAVITQPPIPAPTTMMPPATASPALHPNKQALIQIKDVQRVYKLGIMPSLEGLQSDPWVALPRPYPSDSRPVGAEGVRAVSDQVATPLAAQPPATTSPPAPPTLPVTVPATAAPAMHSNGQRYIQIKDVSRVYRLAITPSVAMFKKVPGLPPTSNVATGSEVTPEQVNAAMKVRGELRTKPLSTSSGPVAAQGRSGAGLAVPAGGSGGVGSQDKLHPNGKKLIKYSDIKRVYGLDEPISMMFFSRLRFDAPVDAVEVEDALTEMREMMGAQDDSGSDDDYFTPNHFSGRRRIMLENYTVSAVGKHAKGRYLWD